MTERCFNSSAICVVQHCKTENVISVYLLCLEGPIVCECNFELTNYCEIAMKFATNVYIK